MAPLRLLSLLAVVVSCALPSASAYTYDLAASDWEGTCASGNSQSPINIIRYASLIGKKSPKLKINYAISQNITLKNTGHTIQVIPQAGTSNTLTFGNQVYTLVQSHGHAFSEHAFNGYFTPFEWHFVHANVANSSDLLVLATLFRLKADATPNPALQAWLPLAPTTISNVTVPVVYDFMSIILPNPGVCSFQYWTYVGSLTTPGCTEGVRFLVIDSVYGPEIARSQVVDWEKLISGVSAGDPVDNRLPMPLHGRKPVRYSAKLGSGGSGSGHS